MNREYGLHCVEMSCFQTQSAALHVKCNSVAVANAMAFCYIALSHAHIDSVYQAHAS